MIVGWVKHFAVLLTLATLCGCASGNRWMTSGNDRFSSQLHSFQRQDVGTPQPNSALAKAVSKLKLAASEARGEVKSITDKSAIVSRGQQPEEDKTDAVSKETKETDMKLTSDKSDDGFDDFETFTAEPPFTEAEPDDSIAAAIEAVEPKDEVKPNQKSQQSDEEIELIAALRHPDAGLRALAAWRLGRLAAPSEDVLFALRNVVAEEENGLVRVRIAEAVAKIDPQDANAIEWLVEALSDGDWQVRWLAAGTLDIAQGGPAANLAVWKLSEALISDEHAKVRQMCALTLGSFGSVAGAVKPHLREALTDDEADVREAADAALACIDAAQ